MDLLSIKAADPGKYALNLMNALFTDEEMGSSCYRRGWEASQKNHSSHQKGLNFNGR